MRMRSFSVLGGLLLVFGCETDVDSPFTAVSAGGTDPATTVTPNEATTSSTGDPDGSSTSDETTSGDPGSSTTASTDATSTTATTTSDDPCDPDPCTAPDTCVDGACVGPASPNAGEVIVNELHPNPDAVTDEQGEWLELRNLAANPVELQGCELTDQGTDVHPIGSSVVIPAGGFAVLGRADANNGGVTLDYVYGTDFTLGNDGDEVILRCGSVIDQVVYGGSWPFGAGTAAQLTTVAGADNDDVANWCEATAPYGDGDLGTPGSANAGC